MSEITMPPPRPTQVALVISDGHRFTTTYVDRGILESDPARAISAAMKTLDAGMESSAMEGGLRGWREPDVVQTERGYALSPAALEEIMKFNYGDDHQENP